MSLKDYDGASEDCDLIEKAVREYREFVDQAIAEKRGALSEYPEMDCGYFSKTENVRHDLGAFANVFQKEIKDLVTTYVKGIYAVCANGEKLQWGTYLQRATSAMGLAENGNKTHVRKSEALARLKEKCGISMPDYIEHLEMDENCFTKIENIRRDLRLMADLCGVSPEALTAGKAMGVESMLCSNGRWMRGRDYLVLAAKKLRLAKSQVQAEVKCFEALAMLKKMSRVGSQA